MKRTILALLAVGTLTGLVTYAPAPAQQANRDATLIAEGKLPPDYRDWRLISVAPGGAAARRAKLTLWKPWPPVLAAGSRVGTR